MFANTINIGDIYIVFKKNQQSTSPLTFFYFRKLISIQIHNNRFDIYGNWTKMYYDDRSNCNLNRYNKKIKKSST